MSQDQIYEAAERSTPQELTVPINSWPALVVWAIGKFGAWVVIAALLSVALERVYTDSKAQDVLQRDLTVRVAEAFEGQSSVGMQQSIALTALTLAVERNTKELENMRQSRGQDYGKN